VKGALHKALSPSELGNLPRWRGQPGFFEIWFFVLFDLDAGQAYWFRYTTFAPRAGSRDQPRATVWAAAFDARASSALAGKSLHPVVEFESPGAGSAVRIGASTFDNQSLCGEVDDGGHTLRWDLRFLPSARPAHRAPWFLHHRMPLPTRVVHAHSEVEFRGSIVVDGQTRVLHGAPGLQKHIWGTRRVEELFWLYCPRFDEDPQARVEATAVRARTQLSGLNLPRLTPIWLQTARGSWDMFGTTHLLRNRVARDDDLSLRFHGATLSRKVDLVASCARESLVGYVYRDPAGSDLYVAQSDIASCTLSLRERSGLLAPLGPVERLHAVQRAALEFHSATPIDGVRYLGWDEGAHAVRGPHADAEARVRV